MSYKPMHEWTNFCMAISKLTTIGICSATVYGEFNQQDHAYVNQLQIIWLGASQIGRRDDMAIHRAVHFIFFLAE